MYSIDEILRLSHLHNASDTISLLHDLESTVDFVQRLPMCDELVDLELAGQVVINKIGQLAAAFDPSKSAPFPYTAGNELERW